MNKTKQEKQSDPRILGGVHSVFFVQISQKIERLQNAL